MNPTHITQHVLAAGLVLLLAPVAGLAERGSSKQRPPGPPRPLARVLEQNAEALGLSDELVAEARQIGQANRESFRELHEELKEAREQLRALIENSGTADGQILSQVGRVTEAEARLRVERTKGMLKVRALLSDEQLQQVLELREQRGGKGKGSCRSQGRANGEQGGRGGSRGDGAGRGQGGFSNREPQGQQQ